MISAQVITTSIEELRAITRVDLCVFDPDGAVVASTFDNNDIGPELIKNFVDSPADSQVIGIDHLLKITDEGELVYVLVARGSSEDTYIVGKIAVSQIQQLMVAYKERFDRNNFFQNLLSIKIIVNLCICFNCLHSVHLSFQKFFQFSVSLLPALHHHMQEGTPPGQEPVSHLPVLQQDFVQSHIFQLSLARM